MTQNKKKKTRDLINIQISILDIDYNIEINK